MKIMVFLQNAWSKQYAGKRWPRSSWLKALSVSRSGQRLRSLESGYPYYGCTWRYENASPIVGDSPDSFQKADIGHIRKLVLRWKPDIVIAMGKEASRGAMIACADHPLTILAPHPASRVLTNDLYTMVGRAIGCLASGLFRAKSRLVSYKQQRGGISINPWPWLIPIEERQNANVQSH